MSRKVTYETNKIPQLRMKLEAMNQQMDNLGYGSRAVASRWLMENNYQKGDPNDQADVNKVAKKVSHILKGYVRGIHKTLRKAGVWSAEEAERIVELLEDWLKTNPKICKYDIDDGHIRQPRLVREITESEDEEF